MDSRLRENDGPKKAVYTQTLIILETLRGRNSSF